MNTSWTIVKHIVFVISIALGVCHGCSWVSYYPTDICMPDYDEELQPPYFKYRSTLYTCIDGYPFAKSWQSQTPNNCQGTPTSNENITNIVSYNCTDYPNSCRYYESVLRSFNHTAAPPSCKYPVSYVTRAYVVDVCLYGNLIYSCNNDNITETQYTGNGECQTLFKNTTNAGDIPCSLYSDGRGWNQTIIRCDP